MYSEFKSTWDGHLGRIEASQHFIEISPKYTRLIHSVPHPAGLRAPLFEMNEIAKMLDLEVIKPAPTEWSSPIVFAPKKDDTVRLGIDYRKLNAVTVRNFHLIPAMDECMNAFGDAMFFSILDVTSTNL